MGRKKKPDKLAQDAAKALAAGVSYGKWMAMKQPVVKTENGLPEGWKICPQCGKKFKARSNKKYCDDYCRQRAYYERELEIQKARYYRKKEQADGKE